MTAMRNDNGAVRCSFMGLCLLAAAARPTMAEPQGEHPAGLIIYPRIEVRSGVDTEVYLANASADTVRVYCVYTDGLGRCSETNEVCQPEVGCLLAQGVCIPSCTQRDFGLSLTPQQVLMWRASAGLAALPLPLQQEGSIPATDDPFIGQLRCLEVDENVAPVARNDLLGSIVGIGPGFSTASYNAVAVPSTGTNDGDKTLCLGANSSGDCATAEYAACPDSLSVNQFFEGAMVEGRAAHSRLTLLPCSLFYQPRPGMSGPDLVSVDLVLTAVNEFEQQTVLARSLTCFADLGLETLPAFGVAVQGTLGGQTFVTSTQSDAGAGPGLVGVIQQTLTSDTDSSSSAHGLSSLGTAARADPIRLLDF